MKQKGVHVAVNLDHKEVLNILNYSNELQRIKAYWKILRLIDANKGFISDYGIILFFEAISDITNAESRVVFHKCEQTYYPSVLLFYKGKPLEKNKLVCERFYREYISQDPELFDLSIQLYHKCLLLNQIIESKQFKVFYQNLRTDLERQSYNSYRTMYFSLINSSNDFYNRKHMNLKVDVKKLNK